MSNETERAAEPRRDSPHGVGGREASSADNPQPVDAGAVLPLAERDDILRVLAAYQRADTYDLWWRVTPEGVEFGAPCNDVFWWATADVEPITPNDLDMLDRCVDALDIIDAGYLLSELFAARKRGMRPQRPFYKNLAPHEAALFDACGPERDPKEEG